MADVIVDTTTGKVRGTADDRIAVFKGIPYARPPVGDRRFRPPQPVVRSDELLEATRASAVALQGSSGLEAMLGARPPRQSEDCLALNVWTPAADDGRRAVMVWIHGGAFLTGSGTTPWYEGTNMATRGDVVVVTLNYRLGALGFLHLGAISDRFEGAANLGLLDQIAALEWVRDNIEAFGGDPGNVTVFGESAGAMSIGTLLAMPAARGLFQRAILQSGASSQAQTADEAGQVTDELLGELGVDKGHLDRLFDLPADAVLAGQGAVVARHGLGSLAFRPTVDGATLPRPPLDAVADGTGAGVPLLVGTTLDEMTLFTLVDPRLNDLTPEAMTAMVARVVGEERARRLVDTYTANRPSLSLKDVYTAIQTDYVFRIPAIRLAEAQQRHAPEVYSYLFTWATPAFGGALKSCHALDVPFVFDNLDKPGVALFTGDDPGRGHLARVMQDAWLAFATGSSPNHPGLPTWPTYDLDRRATMVLDAECAVVDDPYGDERVLWDPVGV